MIGAIIDWLIEADCQISRGHSWDTSRIDVDLCRYCSKIRFVCDAERDERLKRALLPALKAFLASKEFHAVLGQSEVRH